MNNKGKVSIFLCLIMSCILVLASTAYSVSDYYMARGKTAMDTRIALSDVKAGYNDYIFEHYHILAFDLNEGGQGIGGVEKRIEDNLRENLGKNFRVNEVAITEEKTLIENDFEYFKKQINEVIPYVLVDAGIERIREKTGGKDGTLPADVERDMDNAENEKDENVTSGAEGTNNSSDDQNENESSENSGSNKKVKKTKDPRKFTKKLKKSGLMDLVVPEDLEVNSEALDLADTLSGRYGNAPYMGENANLKFNDYSDLKKDLKSHSTWDDKLVSAGETVVYAGKFFNNAVSESVNDDTVLAFEQEYLICGHKSDYNNLKSVINRLVAIRFPLDYACLAKDVKKMAELYEIAVPLSLLTFIPAPVLKYLLAGCWAYVEAIADVRLLLHGKRIDFVKKNSEWITDIDNLGESIFSDKQGSENGMDYSDYLTILMAIESSSLHMRMLDVMEMNVRQYDENFRIDNCAVGIRVEVEVEYQGRKIYVNEVGEY